MPTRRTKQDHAKKSPSSETIPRRCACQDGSMRNLRDRPGEGGRTTRSRRNTGTRSNRNHTTRIRRRHRLSYRRENSRPPPCPMLQMPNMSERRSHTLRRIQENKHRPMRTRRIIPRTLLQRRERRASTPSRSTVIRRRSYDRANSMLHTSHPEGTSATH